MADEETPTEDTPRTRRTLAQVVARIRTEIEAIDKTMADCGRQVEVLRMRIDNEAAAKARLEAIAAEYED